MATPWPVEADGLVALQLELGRLADEQRSSAPFRLPDAPAPIWIGGCFVAFDRRKPGPAGRVRPAVALRAALLGPKRDR